MTWGVPVQYIAEWDGGPSWRAVVPNVAVPPDGLAFSIAHDPVLGRAYVSVDHPNFGFWEGYEYYTLNPATFDTTGAGCPGSLGTPALRLTQPWTRAWLGRTLSVDITNVPQAAFLAYGLSPTTSGPFALPLDLTPFGLPGCTARVAFDAVVPLVATNQLATDTVAVPNTAALLGVAIGQQAFAVDPTGNAAGLSVSNAVRFTIGQP
jgi:hypothetical protein